MAASEFTKHPLPMTLDWLEKLLFIGKWKLKRTEESYSVAMFMFLVLSRVSYCEQVVSADE